MTTHKTTGEPTAAAIPMRTVGPVCFNSPLLTAEINVPLATFESPLWPSVARGARVSVRAGGLQVVCAHHTMTRSIIMTAPSAGRAVEIMNHLPSRQAAMENVVATTSRFARLQSWHPQIAGRDLFLRFHFTTGDAAGHNMCTAAAEQLIHWLQAQFPDLKYGSISGNVCVDKKPAAINGILGRGHAMLAECVIARQWVKRYCKTTPEAIVALNWRKNWVGTNLAGGICTANAHFANMLLAFYLATGQDAANIVEGSQGYTLAEERDGDLYFNVTLPNIIVGTVGNGKELPFVQHNLQQLGCLESRGPGENATRLAAIAAGVVWCGELSLLAAQTNPGELMRAHRRWERP